MVSCLTRYGPKKMGEQSDIHDIVEWDFAVVSKFDLLDTCLIDLI